MIPKATLWVSPADGSDAIKAKLSSTTADSATWTFPHQRIGAVRIEFIQYKGYRIPYSMTMGLIYGQRRASASMRSPLQYVPNTTIVIFIDSFGKDFKAEVARQLSGALDIGQYETLDIMDATQEVGQQIQEKLTSEIIRYAMRRTGGNQ